MRYNLKCRYILPSAICISELPEAIPTGAVAPSCTACNLSQALLLASKAKPCFDLNLKCRCISPSAICILELPPAATVGRTREVSAVECFLYPTRSRLLSSIKSKLSCFFKRHANRGSGGTLVISFVHFFFTKEMYPCGSKKKNCADFNAGSLCDRIEKARQEDKFLSSIKD